jgi:hypothetical protein
MCCFSGPVRHVADTRIFARLSGRGTQYLVYSMAYEAARPVAMILPLPVARQKATPLRFISLKTYPRFFEDLDRAFPEPVTRSRSWSKETAVAASAASLPIVDVGDFVASFVPTLNDFGRLDRRFTLPRRSWDRLPQYRDYGFAVFQLKGTARPTGVHPMALEFATRLRGQLFFPTVHIHDGQVHPDEEFDHALYYQAEPPRRSGLLGLFTRADAIPDVAGATYVRPSDGAIGTRMDVRLTQGIVDGRREGMKVRLEGMLPNRDTLVPVAA